MRLEAAAGGASFSASSVGLGRIPPWPPTLPSKSTTVLRSLDLEEASRLSFDYYRRAVNPPVCSHWHVDCRTLTMSKQQLNCTTRLPSAQAHTARFDSRESDNTAQHTLLYTQRHLVNLRLRSSIGYNGRCMQDVWCGVLWCCDAMRCD